VIVNNSSNINKPKESLKSDGQQFHQYQQSKRKFKKWWLILEELLTIIAKVFFCFVDIGGIVDHHFLNFLLVCWYWRNCWLSLFNSSNFNKTKESLSSDGQQFHQYQENKRKLKQWWSTIRLISTKQKKV
jgi:hypothetical protein